MIRRILDEDRGCVLAVRGRGGEALGGAAAIGDT